jgi:hypothetical protein
MPRSRSFPRSLSQPAVVVLGDLEELIVNDAQHTARREQGAIAEPMKGAI